MEDRGMTTFVFGTGLRRTLEPAPPVAAGEELPEDTDLETLHRGLMPMFRDGEMVDADAPTRMSATVPRRLQCQLAMLAKERRIGVGQLSAEILARYMKRSYRALLREPAA
jgi:hypothetical protein